MLGKATELIPLAAYGWVSVARTGRRMGAGSGNDISRERNGAAVDSDHLRAAGDVCDTVAWARVTRRIQSVIVNTAGW